MSSPTEGQSLNTWSEPPWSGWIETTGDALLILEAARRGLIPRVTRRLVDSERKMITSGSVFVFDEDESGIKRWTDGFFWSPSRILGNFLLYRETEKKGQGHKGQKNAAHDVQQEAEPAQTQFTADPNKPSEGSQSLSRPRGESNRLGIDRHRERSLVGSLTNSYKFKTGGMMKKTFSLTINGVSQHLISYYKVEDVEQGRLRCPSSYPELASLEISPEYLDKTHFRNPPKTEQGPDGLPRYRGEADDVEPSPHSVLDHALSLPVPILSAPTEVGGSSRRKRYEPYSAAGSKASRNARGKKAQGSGTPPPLEGSTSTLGYIPGYPGDPNHVIAPYGQPYSYSLGGGMSMTAPPAFSPLSYPLPGHPFYPAPYHQLPPLASSPSPISPMAGPATSSTAQQGGTIVSPTSPTSMSSSYVPFGGGATAGSSPESAQQQSFYPYFPPPHAGFASPYWAHPAYGYQSPGLAQQLVVNSVADTAQASSGSGPVAEEASSINTSTVAGTERTLHGQLGGGNGDSAPVGVTVT